ncbi:MAG: hypothetical protein IKE00_00085 [Oscillospiraceae bacterium]|nr:hypothetical protein [Oscillospiraceae bacterium]
MKRATHKKKNAPFERLMSLLLVAVLLFGAMGLANSVRAADGENDPVEEVIVGTPDGEQIDDEVATPVEGDVLSSEDEAVDVETLAKPVQRFEDSANGVDVFVYAPEGALPENTKMAVAPVYDENVYSAVEDAVDGTVEKILAVDISFWYAGKEIKPFIPVTVILTSDLIAEADESIIVHVDDEDNASVVDEVVTVSDSTMEFDTKEFSTFAITSISADATPTQWTAVGSKGDDGGGTQGSIMVGRNINNANEWQINSGEYESNTHIDKTVSGFLDAKPEKEVVRVQKNVIPTGTENEFLVYLSADALYEQIVTTESITEMISVESGLYWSGSSNVYPKTIYDSTTEENNEAYDPHKPNGTHAGELSKKYQGSVDQIPVDNEAPGYRVNIWYNGKLIASPVIRQRNPNGVLYLKIDDNNWIILFNYFHGNDYDLSGDAAILPIGEDGLPIANCYLTEMSYNALFKHVIKPATTVSTSVIIGDSENPIEINDPMGSYITYQGLSDGNSNVTEPSSAATEPGTTVTWTINPKNDPLISPKVQSDPETSYVYTYQNEDGSTYETENEDTTKEPIKEVETTVIRTSWWAYNVVEILYKVKLDVTKSGFNSGDIYNVNGPTVLNYVGGSVTFPVPTVLGTLYDFSFEKVDDKGNALTDAMFSLSDGTVPTKNGNKFTFTGLPWGTYLLSETTVPEGYNGASDLELNIGYTSWPEYISHEPSANDIYSYENNWKIVNTENRITVIKEVDIPEDINKNRIDGTYYLALYGNGMYWTDGYPGATGTIICKEIRVVNGEVRIPDGAGGYLTNDDGTFVSSVTFEKVPAGTWSVWEHTNTGNQYVDDDGNVRYTIQAVKAHTIIDPATDQDPAVEINKVSTSGFVTLPSTSSPSVTVTNKYAYHASITHAEAKKAWADYNGNTIDAPKDTTVTFKLYCQEGDDGEITEVTEVNVPKLDDNGELLYVDDVLQTETITISPIELNGEADTNGESEAWTALWPRLPLLSEAGHQLHYMVAESIWPDDYKPYVDQNPMYNGSTISVYQTNVDGGKIVNRKQTTDVTVKKVVEGYNPDDKSFDFTAVYGENPGTTITFSLKHNGEKVLTVPVGAVLTVTEADAELFTTSVTCGDTTENDSSYSCTVSEPTNTILFTNTREVGNLSISKTVSSPVTSDSSRYFEFTITLGDNTLNGSFDATLNTAPREDVTFTNGKASILLKHGDTVNIIGLPAGIGYTVAETSTADTSLNYFNIVAQGEEGTISTTQSAAAFTNTRKTGDLSITKTVVSKVEEDKAVRFSFTIAVDGRLNGTFQAKINDQAADPVTFNANSEAQVVLTDGQTITISGLPEGLNFRITENQPNNFTSSFDDEGRTTATGTIDSNNPSVVVCTNTRNVVDLTIDKVVNGLMGDKTKKFSITITSSKAFMDGETAVTTKTIELADGDEPIALTDVPIGAVLSISETGADDYDKSFTFKATDGGAVTDISDATAFEVTEAGTITVINTKNTIPDTGISLASLPFVLILTLCATAFVVMIVNRRRRTVR